jgi:hypothetical protein
MMKRIEGKGLVISILSLLVVGMVLISGCGRSEKSFSTPDGKVTVKTDGKGQGGTVQMEGKDGKVSVVTDQGGSVTEAELGVPVYPGSTVKATVKMEDKSAGNKGSVEMRTLSSKDNFEKVSGFYKANLKNVKSTFVQGDAGKGMAMFSIGENGEITVNIIGDGDKETTIQVAKKTK